MISFEINASYFLAKSTTAMQGAELSSEITAKIYPAWFKEITIEWTLPAEWGNVYVNLYKSAASQTGYLKVNTQPLIGNTWVDRDTHQDSNQRVDYYIVEAVLSTGAIYRSNPIFLHVRQTSHVHVRANEISRRESFMLRKFMGVPVVLLKKRTYGQRCRECWNEEYQKTIKDNCSTCAGTSFEGGYFPGVVSYMQFEPSSKSLQFTHFGKLESNQTSCWTTSLPRMDPHDIIVRLDDYKVFSLSQVRQTELQGATVRQMAAVTELNHDSPEFALIDKYDLMSDTYEIAGLSHSPGTDTAGPIVLGGMSSSL